MQVERTISSGALWAGRIITGLVALFLIVDGGAKLFKPQPVIDATVRLGVPESLIIPIGVILLVCTVVYLIPQTSVLGAILLTGFLGGAVATQVRAGEGAFPSVFPIIMAALMWLGLYLRNSSLRVLVPITSN